MASLQSPDQQPSHGQIPAKQPSPARRDPPRVGIKLTASAKDKQKKNPNYIMDVLEKTQTGSSSGASAFRLFNTRTPEEIDALVGRAKNSDRTYQPVDLNAWYQVYLRAVNPDSQEAPSPFDDPSNVDSLIVDLRKHPDVDNAYALRTGPPPGPQFPLDANGYLNSAAQCGLDVKSAWQIIGDPQGKTAGKGVKLVDIEGGWYRFPSDGSEYAQYNDDLPNNIRTLNPMVEDDTRWHGNNVLGIIFMTPGNTFDGSGIASAGLGYTMGHTFPGPALGTPDGVNIALAILESLVATDDSADHPDQFLLGPGDVILLETSTATNATTLLPAMMPSECEPPTFALIQIATAIGIIVVEAAGNAGNDLATVGVGGKFVFDKSKPSDFRDSGAILVGACDPTTLARWSVSSNEGSNFGERIDVFAWGAGVSTTGLSGPTSNDFDESLSDFCPDPKRNIPPFGGTSAAAAIIAGAIMLIQGYAQQQQNGLRYSPSQIRELLKFNGTNSKDSNNQDTSKEIGVMPNLAQILRQIGQVPDIYLRHNPDDKGDGTQTLTLNNCSSSPDIILNPQGGAQVSNPYILGADQNITVTLHNRGNASAANATISVYWVHAPTDLADLTKWTMVGTATIANVAPHAGANDGVAEGSVIWPANTAPTGSMTDLCLIAIATCPTDPGFSVADMANALNTASTDPTLNADKQKLYLELLGSNNNIAQLSFPISSGH